MECLCKTFSYVSFVGMSNSVKVWMFHEQRGNVPVARCETVAEAQQVVAREGRRLERRDEMAIFDIRRGGESIPPPPSPIAWVNSLLLVAISEGADEVRVRLGQRPRW